MFEALCASLSALSFSGSLSPIDLPLVVAKVRMMYVHLSLFPAIFSVFVSL